MTWRNHDDVAQQLAAAGLIIDAKRGLEVGTSHFVRCKAIGGGTEKRGWYKLYTVHLPDGSALIGGSFGINSGNDHGTQRVEWSRDDRKQLTPQQVEANRARAIADRKAADAEIERKQEAAAAKAARWWRKCHATGDVPYLIRKGFAPGRLYGARVSDAGNLVIPVQDARGKTWGLQVIYQDPKIKERKGRDKDFAPPGLKITGNVFVIGSPAPGGVALLCEGFATGCTLHEATGMPVVVAYTAGNLLPSAKAIVAHYRGIRLMVCADDDYLQTCSECKSWTTVTTPECTVCGEPHRKRNAGIGDARTTALAVDQPRTRDRQTSTTCTSTPMVACPWWLARLRSPYRLLAGGRRRSLAYGRQKQDRGAGTCSARHFAGSTRSTKPASAGRCCTVETALFLTPKTIKSSRKRTSTR
jgi:putative DNA primase/helicase